MNKKRRLFFCAGTVLLVLAACRSMPPAGDQGRGRARSAMEQTLAEYDSQAAGGPAAGTAGPSGAPAAGQSILLTPITGEGLGTDDTSAGIVDSGFRTYWQKYSGMLIFSEKDIQDAAATLEKWNPDDRYIQLAANKSVHYMLRGTIRKLSNGYYFLSLNIIMPRQDQGGVTAASFAKDFPRSKLEDLSAVKEAVKELLDGMGIPLSGAAAADLTGAASRQEIQGAASIAAGISAGKRGDGIHEILSYLDAARYSSALSADAFDRINAAFLSRSTGDLRADFMNDLAEQRNWKQILQKTEDLFRDRPPYSIVRIAEVSQNRSKTDYDRQTGTFETVLELRPLEEAFAVIRNIQEKLEATGRKEEWKFENWPQTGVNGRGNPVFASGYLTVDAELVNDNGKRLGIQRIRLRYSTENSRYGNAPLTGRGDRVTVSFDGIKVTDVTRSLQVKVAIVPDGAVLPAEDFASGSTPFAFDAIHSGIYLSGGLNLQPAGGAFELGLELGGRGWNIDGGLILGGGGLDSNNKTSGIEDPMIMGWRAGFSFPFYGQRWRLNTGGGIEVLSLLGQREDWAGSSSSSGDSKKTETIDTLAGPYGQVRFDYVVYDNGIGVTVFGAYRLEFLPADKFDAWFLQQKKAAIGPFRMRDALFAGVGILF